jgi:hypothetical protein
MKSRNLFAILSFLRGNQKACDIGSDIGMVYVYFRMIAVDGDMSIDQYSRSYQKNVSETVHLSETFFVIFRIPDYG